MTEIDNSNGYFEKVSIRKPLIVPVEVPYDKDYLARKTKELTDELEKRSDVENFFDMFFRVLKMSVIGIKIIFLTVKLINKIEGIKNGLE